MRYGTSIYQRSYPMRYNPLRGRRVLSEQTGFFKESARFLGLSGIVGIDPKHESGLLLNRPIQAKHEANTNLSHFLERYKGMNTTDIQFFSDDKGINSLTIGNNAFNTHHYSKRGDYYYVKTHNKNFNTM